MKKSLLYLVLFLAANVVGGAVAMLLNQKDKLLAGVPIDKTGLTVDAESIGAALFWTYVVLVVLMWLLKLTPRRSGNTEKKRRCLPEFSAMMGVVFLAYALSFLTAPLNLSDGGMMAQFEAMKSSVPCVLLLTVLGPLVEELVFRAGVLRSLLQSRWHPSWAILTTAALFAVAHGNLMQALPALVSGSLFGVYYYRSGGLRLPLMAHILNNTLAVLAMYFPVLEGHFEVWPPQWQVAAGLVMLCLSLLCVLAWWRKTPQSTDETDKKHSDENRND